MTERIGIVVGMEESFPDAFIESVNKIPGFSAEFAKIGGTKETWQCPYRVLIDRISHEVPCYRLYLKAAALSGAYVINDPLWWSADDKFFGFSLAQRLGVTVPRTVLLPSRSYIPAIDPNRSLRNLEFPLDWEGIADYVRFPAILKPAEGGGWKSVSRVNNMDELIRDYNESEQLVMTLQEFIDFEEYVRCICIGKDEILPIKYDPRQRCYVEAEKFLTPALEALIVDSSKKLNNALNYDMNSVEFAIRDGIPYAIDFTNPAPDMHRHSVLPKYFDWCVDRMTRLVTDVVREGRTMKLPYAFTEYLPGRAKGNP